jgi:hypothetical protein
MNKVFAFVAFSFFLFNSCTELDQDKSVKPINEINSELSFENLKYSVWVDGEIGQNGELPDTIVFIKIDSLLFLGQEPSTSEVCPYFFEKDTLTFIDHGTVDDDSTLWTYISRLKFENNKFKYLYIDYKSPYNKNWIRTEMKNTHTEFRELNKKL